MFKNIVGDSLIVIVQTSYEHYLYIEHNRTS